MRRILALIGISLREIPQRPGNSLVIVVGTAGVVVVLIPVLALYNGFRTTLGADGRWDRAVILSRDATEEYNSSLSREGVAYLENSAGVRHDSRRDPIVSAEVVIGAPVSRRRDQSDVTVTLRGVGMQYFVLRPELKLLAGRMFHPGTQELVVGDAAQAQFNGLHIGNIVRLDDDDWSVVGVFGGGRGTRDSELIADAQTVASVYKLSSFNSMVVALQSPGALASLREAVANNANLAVSVYAEPQYLTSSLNADPVNKMLRLVTYTIGSIMALGAFFAGLNSIYSSVAKRATEMATLRAIGFPGVVVAIAVLTEAVLLALVGAVTGAAVAYWAFNGVTISTLGGALFESQLVYSLSITASLLANAVALACLLGLAGGLLPAIRAARTNVASLLQES